jgi:hypothetical protein
VQKIKGYSPQQVDQLKELLELTGAALEAALAAEFCPPQQEEVLSPTSSPADDALQDFQTVPGVCVDSIPWYSGIVVLVVSMVVVCFATYFLVQLLEGHSGWTAIIGIFCGILIELLAQRIWVSVNKIRKVRQRKVRQRRLAEQLQQQQ